MDTFIRSQKKFLDAVAEESAHATEGTHNGKHARKTELTELARQATEAFIDAQKKLLDVAAQQVAVNVKVTRETMKKLNPVPPFKFADVAKNTVDSFVAAQKALLDVMAKPVRGTAAPEPVAHKAKRPVPKHHKPSPVPVPA